LNQSLEIRYKSLGNNQDLVDLINANLGASRKFHSDPIRLEDLHWCVRNCDEKFAFYTFEIPKKSGGARTISAPCRRLKMVLRALNELLVNIHVPNDCSHGFETEKSIASNASTHVGANYVYNLDLSDFFGSVNYKMVVGALRNLSFKPISIKQERSIELDWTKFIERYKEELIVNGIWGDGNPDKVLNRFRELDEFRGTEFEFIYLGKMGEGNHCRVLLGNERSRFKHPATILVHTIRNDLFMERHNRLLNVIARLCTQKVVKQGIEQRVLPQGAPTSPILSNMAAAKLDLDLTRLARKYNLRYTRYADDITFSSAYNAYAAEGDFIQALKNAISRNGFTVNEAKCRLQSRHHRQEVTGLNVNSKVSIRKSKVKQIRMWLYLIERYGYDRANTLFSEHRKTELILFLRGYLSYMAMIYGKESNKVVSLRKRLLAISGEETVPEVAYTDSMIETILLHGFDKGMDIIAANGNQ
jgi:hypothetical protein